ncbi:MAG: ribosomal protein S18-alanine N-acetyltransferase [Alphaproteobacteria bacterium]|nr:ribosomal protein S18-alanine N-acetyltransferase [Alphaproteobacteria bacterium]
MAAIERASIQGGWSREQLAEELDRDIACALVVERDGVVLGHAIGWAVAGEAQVLELAVHPEARRQGLGRLLLEALVAACGGGEALLELREGNGPARGLYRAAGFAEVGRRPGYYPDGEAAILMTRPPPEGA